MCGFMLIDVQGQWLLEGNKTIRSLLRPGDICPPNIKSSDDIGVSLLKEVYISII